MGVLSGTQDFDGKLGHDNKLYPSTNKCLKKLDNCVQMY